MKTPQICIFNERTNNSFARTTRAFPILAHFFVVPAKLQREILPSLDFRFLGPLEHSTTIFHLSR